MTQYKYIHFEQVEQKPRTKVWACRTNGGDEQLGTVAWFNRRRRYCFFAEPLTVFSEECLADIQDFVRQQNKEHKNGASNS